MSTRIEGRVEDETGSGRAGLHVSLRVVGPLLLALTDDLGSGVTDANGRFAFTYDADTRPPPFRRRLEVVVEDAVGRELARTQPFDDVDGDPLTLDGPFVVPTAEIEGLKVTLGTGVPSRVSTGNAVTWLTDADQFSHVAGLLEDAQQSIYLSQLFFSVPPSFDADATKETTKLVFRFASALDAANLRAAGVGDARPERLLLQAADEGVDVRLLLNSFEFPLFLKILVGVLAAPFVWTDTGRSIIDSVIGSGLTDYDEVKRYFAGAGNPNVLVDEFPQSPFTAGVMHAKLVVVDGGRAASLGSPLGQGYVDSQEHHVEAPMRGAATGFPMHDAGFGVTGPAVADLHDAFKMLWDQESPTKVPAPASAPSPVTSGGEGVCTMQVARTVSVDRITPGLPDGEKGILEAYLRAIAAAEQLVYLETQYFTNDAIGEALVKRMQQKAALQVILVCNIRPDVPTYPFKQRRLITRIRKGIGQTGNGPRFGVFTRWSHLVGTPRPFLVPVYIHAKVGIVDDAWATVGSANLDGLSLDSSLVSDWFRPAFGMREQRAIEVNGLVFNGHGEPATDLVDLLRRKLWAEHLGFFTSTGTIDPARPALTAPPATGGWLGLWQQRADETLDHLRNTPALPLGDKGRVLPWPDDDETYKTPRTHMDALGIRTFKVVPLKSTRKFDFETGTWDDKGKAKWDYP